MNRRTLLLAAAVALAAMVAAPTLLPAAGGVAGVWQLGRVAMRLWHVLGSGQFIRVEGAKDIYRLDLWWRALPVLRLPVTAFLVREGREWVLVDAGASDNWSHGYGSQLVGAMQRTIPKGDRLKAILLTHTHFDHIGVLPLLAKLAPDVPVILHSNEAPYLTGEQQHVPPGSAFQRALQALGVVPYTLPQLPASKLTLLPGSQGGSLREHGITSLRPPMHERRPSCSWVATPGHSPGHIAFLHEPSGTVIAGDAVSNVMPSVAWSSGIGAIMTRPLGWATGTAARLALAPARATLGGLLGNARQTAENATKGVLGALGVERVAPSANGTEMGAVKSMRFLPGLSVRITPAFICPKPATCDVAQAERSICLLAALKFNRLMPGHDATGRGLAAADMVAFCNSLPSAA